MPKDFWVGPTYRFPVIWNAGTQLLSINKEYRYRVGTYRYCKMLINSEILSSITQPHVVFSFWIANAKPKCISDCEIHLGPGLQAVHLVLAISNWQRSSIATPWGLIISYVLFTPFHFARDLKPFPKTGHPMTTCWVERSFVASSRSSSGYCLTNKPPPR